MKKYLLLLVILFTTGAVSAQDDGSRTIDGQDSVIFDLFHQTQASGYVKFPVYIASNDTVNAVDFTFWYNTADFTFDTIINIASNLSSIYNEVKSATDTFVIFSSYTTTTASLPSHSNLLTVQFLGGTLCQDDLDSVVVMLNGAMCSAYVTNCSTIGIEELRGSKNTANVYPNPAADHATVEFSLIAKNNITLSVYDDTGKIVYQTRPSEYSSGSHKVNLDTSGFESGIYVIRVNSDKETTSTRLSVIR